MNLLKDFIWLHYRELESQRNAPPFGSSMAERQRFGCLDRWPCNCKQTPTFSFPIGSLSWRKQWWQSLRFCKKNPSVLSRFTLSTMRESDKSSEDQISKICRDNVNASTRWIHFCKITFQISKVFAEKSASVKKILG